MSSLITLCVSFFISLCLALLLRPLALRLNLTDTPGGRKQHQGNIPLIGGIAIFIGVFMTLLSLPISLSTYRPWLMASIILVFVGMLDDFQEVSVKIKFLAQIVASLIMVYWGHNVLTNLGYLFFHKVILLKNTQLLFTLFGVLSVINAVNMLDGLDGLAGGVVLIIFLFMLLLSVLAHQTSQIFILLAFIGALIGFLALNYRLPGRKQALIFMGDAGSLLLGFSLAWFSVQFSQGSQPLAPPIVFLWLMALPLLDTAYVMFRRIAKGISPFRADRRHLHYLLLDCGLSVRQATLIMYSLTILFGLIGVTAYYFHIAEAWLFIAALIMFVIYCVTLHFLWRVVNKKRTLQQEQAL